MLVSAEALWWEIDPSRRKQDLLLLPEKSWAEQELCSAYLSLGRKSGLSETPRHASVVLGHGYRECSASAPDH